MYYRNIWIPCLIVGVIASSAFRFANAATNASNKNGRDIVAAGWIVRPSFNRICYLSVTLRSTEPPVESSNIDKLAMCSTFQSNPSPIAPIIKIFNQSQQKSAVGCVKYGPNPNNLRLTAVASRNSVYFMDVDGAFEHIGIEDDKLCGNLSSKELRHVELLSRTAISSGKPYKPGGFPAKGYANVCFLKFSVTSTMVAMTPRYLRFQGPCFNISEKSASFHSVLRSLRLASSHAPGSSYCTTKGINTQNVRLEIELWSGEGYIADQTGFVTADDAACGQLGEKVQKRIDGQLVQLLSMLKGQRRKH